MPTRINPVTGKVEEISDEDAAILYSGPGGVPPQLAEGPRPGALPPLPARGRFVEEAGQGNAFFDDLEQSMAPIVERTLPGEFGAGLARGLGPQSLELTGQAMRGIGLERAGEAVRGAGRAVEAAAPSIFRPSTAAQVPGSWRSNVYNAAQSVGTSLGISAPGVAAALLTGGGAAPVIGALMLSTPGIFAGAEFQNFYDEGRKAGIPDDLLRMPALASAAAEGGLELLGNVAEALLITRGYGRLAARGIINRTKGGVKAVMIPKITQTLAEGAAGSAIEGGTEALTDVAQTQLRQGVGIPSEGQAGTAFTVGAMAGAIFSGVGKGAARLQQRSQLNTLASAEAPQEARLEQMNRVVARMEEGNVDDEMITQFSNYAADAIYQGQPIPLGEDIAGLAPGPWQGPPSPMQGPPAPMQGPPSPTPLSPMPTVEEPLSPIEQPPSPLAPPPAQVSSFLAGETQAAREATTQPALTAAPEISDAALQIVLDAEQRGFQGFNYQQEAAQLSQNYQIPLQQAQRVLSEAISADRQDVQQTAPIVQPEAISEPAVEPAPAIQPPVPLTQPRGPQLPSGTAARLAAPRQVILQAQAAVETPTAVAPPPTQPRTPQLPPGITGRLAAQPPLPPAGEAVAEGNPPTSAPTPETPQGLPTSPEAAAPVIEPSVALRGPMRAARRAERARALEESVGSLQQGVRAQGAQFATREEAASQGITQGAEQLPVEQVLTSEGDIESRLGEAPQEQAPPPPPEQFQARPQTQAQGNGEPWTLTPQEVQAAYPGIRVLELPEGGFRIETPAGYNDLKAVDVIQMGDEQRATFELDYGMPYTDDVSPAGRITYQQGGALIELVKGKANRVTLVHEIQHWLEHSGQLTPDEIQQLSEATGKDEPTAEDRAEFVGRSLNERRYRRDTAVGRILDQIWDYLDRLLALVGIRTTRGILRQIETGEVMNRGAITTDTSAGRAEQFQATRPTPEQAPTENKLFTEYQSFLNYANPTVEYLFRTNKAYFVKQIVSLGQLDRESAAVLQYWDDHPKDHIRVMKQWATHQQVPTRAELGALKSLAKSYADVLMAGVREGTLTNEAFIEAKDKLIGPNTIFNMTTGVFSELGRMLRMAQDLNPEARFMQLMVQKQERIGRILTPEEYQAYVAEYNKAAMTGDAADMEKFLGKVKAENPTVWDYLKEFWYGSVLSGFPTWIANTGGNTLWTTFSLGALRPVEAFLDHFIAKHQNRPQQYFMSEVLPSLAGFGRGLVQKPRLQALYPGMKTGEFEMPGIQGIGKFQRDMELFTSPWKNATWQLDFPMLRKLGVDVGPLRRKLKDAFGIEPGQPINAMRSLAPIVSLGTRAMLGMDLLGKAAAYDGIIAGMVERQITQELSTGDLTPEHATARRVELLKQGHEPTDPKGAIMRKQASEEAMAMTFMDPISGLAKLILQGRQLPVIGKPFHMLMPFVATADRLIYRALELVPGVGAWIHKDELTHWKTGGPEVTAIMARQIAGAFISIMMLELFRQGVLTGDIPDDPGEREAFLRAGKQPRSFKVGDYYISYQRFEPLNLMLGWLPSMVQAAQRAYERDDQAGGLAVIGTMGAIAAKHILEASYFSGLNSAITGINRPQGDQTESFIGRMVDSWVPFSGARRSITRAWDAYQTGEGAIVRDPQGFLQYISGASLVSDVRPRYNVFGQPIVTPGNIAAQFIPYRISVANRDPVENELARFKIYPGPPSQQDAKGNKMPQGQYEFLVQHGGQLMKGKLDRLVGQAYYQRLSPELRELYLRRAIRQAREEARDELAARSRARGVGFGG